MTYSQRPFDEATFKVGSQCQFSMASVNEDEDDGSFCFDPEKIEYSEPTTCIVQGKGANQTIKGALSYCKSDVVSIVSCQ